MKSSVLNILCFEISLKKISKVREQLNLVSFVFSTKEIKLTLEDNWTEFVLLAWKFWLKIVHSCQSEKKLFFVELSFFLILNQTFTVRFFFLRSKMCILNFEMSLFLIIHHKCRKISTKKLNLKFYLTKS